MAESTGTPGVTSTTTAVTRMVVDPAPPPPPRTAWGYLDGVDSWVDYKETFHYGQNYRIVRAASGAAVMLTAELLTVALNCTCLRALAEVSCSDLERS